ncbi:MAG TPA: transporter substrate-binding domain-containing protein [Cyclobacteriaceae bacterium]|nr:transporter substrate-binding domain-containing protein [Cyclobacteriaceae bacterium]
MPRLTRYLCFFLLFALSCSQPNSTTLPAPEVEIDLEAIKKRGYITALVDNNSFSYFIYKGRPIGFEYELLRLLAKQLKVELKIKIISGVENGIHQLNTGEGDILAFPLTVTKERTEYVSFSRPLFNSYQVLVQRKPDNWKTLTQSEIDKNVVRDAHTLIGQEVHVMKSSSFAERIRNLSHEIGGDIVIVEDSANAESESLIKQVALGNIQYTVADHQIAMVNANYYPNLDVSTILSLPQQIAWSVRKNSPELLKVVDTWLMKIKKEPTFMVIYNRYFKSPRTSLLRARSDYSSLFGGDKISTYDDLIKKGAEKLGWDWRLLAALIYQESRFVTNNESWAGARGLMQLMPETAKRFGATNPDDPRQSINAGVNYLKHLDKYWAKNITDANERLKFVLASYNAGLTHIIDARALTKKHGGTPVVWDEVEYFLLKKSDPVYYRDPVVAAGYCKCEEPVSYIKHVLSRFEEYKLHINT